MTPDDRQVEEALRAVGDDYVRRNPADLHRARSRVRQLRRRRQVRSGAMSALATAAVLAVAVYAWPSGDAGVTRPRPAGRPSALLGSASIHVGGAPFEVAVARGAVWVADTEDFGVKRIDPATDRVVDTIPLEAAPGDLAIDHTGAVWVAMPGLGEVRRIDPVTNDLTPDIRVDVGGPDTPLDLAVDRYLWVSAVGDEIVQVDLRTGAEVGRVEGLRPVNVAARSGGVFVLGDDGVVRGIDPDTGTPTGVEIAFDVEGRGDVHLYGELLWVAQGDGSELFSADPAGGSDTIRSYPFRGEYMEMVLDPRGIAVLSSLGDGTGLLSVFEAGGAEATELAELPGDPRDLVRGLDDLWVTNAATGTLTRLEELPRR